VSIDKLLFRYGLTDIQEYYANTGALKKAAENNREVKSGNCVRRSDVSVSVIEATEKDVRPRELEEMLRMEYRTKLLNPKWSDALLRQGSSGAYEISGRLTAMIGWASTAGFSEEWLWNATSNKYAMDAEMASELRASNPEAFRNIVVDILTMNPNFFLRI
jgi:magnesium chelatase subunit H